MELPATYDAGLLADVSSLRAELLRLAVAPARMIGTGGTMTLARLAAQLHEQISRQPGQAVTPLQLLQGPSLARCGAMLFSARARHPDALLVLERFARGEYEPSVLVTHRDAEDLAEHANSDIAVVTVPPPTLAEGFLATNSVLAMTVALLRAALGDDVLSKGLLDQPSALLDNDAVPRGRILVLYPPHLAPVAVDLETRCAELGIASVQLSDLRNVAHGRHTGLSRTAEETTVLVISDAASGALADAVAAPLASSGAEIVRWHAEQTWPEALVTLLVVSMHLTSKLATPQGLDPAKPRVPEFGRRLYHLPLKRLLARPPQTPIERKVYALGGGESVPDRLFERYNNAFQVWTRDLATTSLGGIVLDYDGTVCLTAGRYDPPSNDMHASLIALLDGGLRVGFASGRGKSLHEGLRKWVPEHHWADIELGLYNGAVQLTLANAIPEITTPSQLMQDVVARLQATPFTDMLELTPRSGQVGVQVQAGAFFRAGRLAELVTDVLARAPRLPVKAVASGHSVDVIADETSKVRVLERVASVAAGPVLAVGDQGDIGGNDFELLAATPWSISAARCSSDPSRCWCVDPIGRIGPAAVVPLLQAIDVSLGMASLDVRRIAKRRRHA